VQSEFATVGTYSTSIEAHTAKNFLEANGLRAFVADEHSSNLGWWNLLETKVQVPAADAETAKGLLSAL
jgi:hypothetical protein